MWKVRLKDNGYNNIEFNFENFYEASVFLCDAVEANKNIQAIVSLEDENKAVEEGEE